VCDVDLAAVALGVATVAALDYFGALDKKSE
jgi:hypothetical protein